MLIIGFSFDDFQLNRNELRNSKTIKTVCLSVSQPVAHLVWFEFLLVVVFLSLRIWWNGVVVAARLAWCHDVLVVVVVALLLVVLVACCSTVRSYYVVIACGNQVIKNYVFLSVRFSSEFLFFFFFAFLPLFPTSMEYHAQMNNDEWLERGEQQQQIKILGHLKAIGSVHLYAAY